MLLVVGPLAGRWLLPRPRLALALTLVSLVPVFALTLVPVDRELFERCTVQWALPTPGRPELFANVVLLAVPALLAAIATRRPLLVLFAASGFSAGLETLQALIPAIGRSCDTNDWLANTIGAAVGVAVAFSASWRSAEP